MTGPLARLVGRSRSPVAGLRPRPASRYERRSPAAGPPVLDGDLEGHADGDLDGSAPRPVTEPPQAAEPAVPRPDLTVRAPRTAEPGGTGPGAAGLPSPDRPTRALSAVPAPPVAREGAPVRSDGPSQPPALPVRVEATVSPAASRQTAPEPGRAAPDPRTNLVRDPADEPPPPTPQLPRDGARRTPDVLGRPLLHAHARLPALTADLASSTASEADPVVVVEVSIGRLDVRTPPSPAPSRAAARPPAVRADHARALENYLRRRAEGELG
ncbi:hypothetical protein [Streptomyces sp. NBC_01451]|uniref:hypothetical protein n=1 Tax=Streptomyces sp. NBC_01451 TaxID=2903872 RepID=UPI002E3664B8|nr:hypothetical protein [Streptomyces sp. NBC_01451]